MKLYQLLAQRAEAFTNCCASGNEEWKEKHLRSIRWLVENFMPSGSGFDHGTAFVMYKDDKLMFTTSFHHMDSDGYYDGWTDHDVYVRPSLAYGILMSITGPDKDNVKDVIHETFSNCLNIEIESGTEAASYQATDKV